MAVYVFRPERERELVHVYRSVYDGADAPGDELDGGRFWTRDEILGNIGKGLFTPNFDGEAKRSLGQGLSLLNSIAVKYFRSRKGRGGCRAPLFRIFVEEG